MARVRAYATMHIFLEWEGEVPDDIPADERWRWVMENVDGGDFVEADPFAGDWIAQPDVDLIEAED